MDKNIEGKRKQKGGAEKTREKKKKLLEKDANQYQKVSSLFKVVAKRPTHHLHLYM